MCLCTLLNEDLNAIASCCLQTQEGNMALADVWVPYSEVISPPIQTINMYVVKNKSLDSAPKGGFCGQFHTHIITDMEAFLLHIERKNITGNTLPVFCYLSLKEL